jgi:hypothetical protein
MYHFKMRYVKNIRMKSRRAKLPGRLQFYMS